MSKDYEKPKMEVIVVWACDDVVTASEGDYEYTEPW